MPNLVEISPVVLQKKIVNFVKEFLQIVLILPGKMGVVPNLNISESILIRMLCANFC